MPSILVGPGLQGLLSSPRMNSPVQASQRRRLNTGSYSAVRSPFRSDSTSLVNERLDPGDDLRSSS